jgi:hypothetical protein
MSHINPFTRLLSWFCLQVPDGNTNEKCVLWAEPNNICSVWMLTRENSKNASNVSVATRRITQLERAFFLKTLSKNQFPPFLTFLILWTIGCMSNDGPPVKVKNIL